MTNSVMVPYLIESMKLTNLKILLGPALYLGSSGEGGGRGGGMDEPAPRVCGKAGPITCLSCGSMGKGEIPPLDPFPSAPAAGEGADHPSYQLQHSGRLPLYPAWASQ